ncbi:hypothetical protein, partial [Klebsiella variicola]|uniref:hypothetical protein n=1 Tax=Klebsiella variicola TaxID=244366 RepID=UPI002B05FCE1
SSAFFTLAVQCPQDSPCNARIVVLAILFFLTCFASSRRRSAHGAREKILFGGTGILIYDDVKPSLKGKVKEKL